MSKHTQGPWTIREPFQGSYSVEPSVAWLGSSSSHTRGENLANANLIAAAPDMLEALELALSNMDETGGSLAHEHYEQVEAVIRKAKSEA